MGPVSSGGGAGGVCASGCGCGAGSGEGTGTSGSGISGSGVSGSGVGGTTSVGGTTGSPSAATCTTRSSWRTTASTPAIPIRAASTPHTTATRARSMRTNRTGDNAARGWRPVAPGQDDAMTSPLRRALVAATALTLASVPAAVEARSKPKPVRKATPPADFIASAAHLSHPDFPQTIREATTVAMADGERLYVEIVRPDPVAYLGRRFPVVLEASPYHGTLADRSGTRIFPDPVDADGKPLGLTGYFAPR